MKFSILVPVYNVEKYLEQCVESLLNQTYKGEYEIILVDDGSTDSSGKICDRYAKNNPDKIKVVHNANGGHTSARLEAINNATGEYTLFCDSDDFVEVNLLETVYNVLIDNPNTDMVMYSFCYFSDDTKNMRKKEISDSTKIYTEKKELYEILIATPLINSLWTKVIKTKLLQNLPIDYNLLIGKALAEDAYMVAHFLNACHHIINIPVPLYNYRIIDESISRSYRPETINKKNTVYVYNRFKEFLPEWNMDDNEHIQKLNARWLDETIYTFNQYYENVNRKDRKAVLEFDWSSMMPDDAKSDFSNPYVTKTSRNLYNWLEQKKYLKIKIHFIRKKTYKNLRKLKARLLK